MSVEDQSRRAHIAWNLIASKLARPSNFHGDGDGGGGSGHER